MELKDLLKIDFTPGPKGNGKATLFVKATVDEAALNPVKTVCSLIASAAGHGPGFIPETLGADPHAVASNVLAAIYQDDDAHDTCTLTACLNPLHPGPCKGWKGTLFKTAPHAFHALEAARVEKANATRLKKIQALKEAGKPIPKKLLQPIVAKPHPHAGKTANGATGEAHAAGMAVTHNAGVHLSEPGKVTLGQAVKTIKATDATSEKGAKGLKPTVASKGIAHVIAQEKVTPAYKLSKAEAITPEQWNALSHDEKAIIRGELAKIQKDGFGPQQKKATELLDKLPAEGKTAAPTKPLSLLQQAAKQLGKEPPKHVAQATVTEPPAVGAPPAAKKGQKFVYTVTHDGKTTTRTSAAAYTHASLVQKGHGGPVVVWGFHKSEANALSTPLTSSQKQSGFKVVGALPVQKEPLKGKSKPSLGESTPEAPKAETPATPEAGKPKVTMMHEVKEPATSKTQAAAIVAISNAIPGVKNMDPATADKLAASFDTLKAKGDLKTSLPFMKAVNALANKALDQAVKDKMPGLGHGDKDAHLGTFHKEITQHILDGDKGLPPLVAKMVKNHESVQAGKGPLPSDEEIAAKKAEADAKIAEAVKAHEANPPKVQQAYEPGTQPKGAPELNAAQKAAQHAIYNPGGPSGKILSALTALTSEEFKGLSAKEQGSVIKTLTSFHQYNPDLKKTVAEAMAKYTDGPAKAMWEKEAAKPAYTPTMTSVGKYLLESGTLGKGKASAAERLATYKKLTGEEFGNLSKSEQAFVLHELTAMQKAKNLNTGTALALHDKFTAVQEIAAEKAKTPEAKKAELDAEIAKIGEAIKAGKTPPVVHIAYEPGEEPELIPDKPKVPEAEKPKPLPKHVQHAIDMANGHAPGASWSKNHLLAYQPLTGEEFKALPGDVQDKIISDLKKAGTKLLDPKKLQATKETLEKFKAALSAPKAPEAPSAPAAVAKPISQTLHDHSISQADAKTIAGSTSTMGTWLVVKGVADLNGPSENPDSATIQQDAKTTAKELLDAKTKLYTQEVLKQPAVKAAMDHFEQVAATNLHTIAVKQAKDKAFNKVSKKLYADGHPDITEKLSPVEKAFLEKYKAHLLNHPVDTSPDTMTKMQSEAQQATKDLDAALHEGLAKANAPSVQVANPAWVKSEAVKLLGPEADAPKVGLTMAEIKYANELGKMLASGLLKKYPNADVLTDPNLAAKFKHVEIAAGQLAATKLNKQKLAAHLAAHHENALGDPMLSAKDKEIVKAHAELIKGDFKYLDTTEAEQQKKLDAAEQAFKDVASKSQAPTGQPEISEYDTNLIQEAYQKAWSGPANKAVLYGVKSYSQKADMKAHPDYVPLTEDLGKLRALSGQLALAHAKEHTAELNVPTDPDTGEKIDPQVAEITGVGAAEWQAWLDAKNARADLEKQGADLLKQAQTKLDTIRTSVGLKKRALPKLDAPAVKAAAAEHGFYKSSYYNGPNYGKSYAAKHYMMAKVGPKHATKHLTPGEKKAEKLADTAAKEAATPSAPGAPVKLGGGDSSIASLPASLKTSILGDFKGMPNGKYLADPAEDIFNNLVVLAAAHGKDVSGGLSVDQVLKSIDETHSKNLGVANSGMMHKKITEWLGTAEGKQYAETHSIPDQKKVKELTGEVTPPPGVTFAPGQKVQQLSGPGAHDKTIPESAFTGYTAGQAQAEQDAYMQAQGLKWTAAQKKAMTAYTGNGYSAYEGINNYLRGKPGFNPVVKQYAVEIQSAMQPSRRHQLLKRGTGWPPEIASYASHPHDLLGETFEDHGFVSTTVAGSSGHFSSKPLQLTIEAPKGTPGVFVNGISHYKGSENELLLAAGLSFKVLSVEQKHGQTFMRVRIVGNKTHEGDTSGAAGIAAAAFG